MTGHIEAGPDAPGSARPPRELAAGLVLVGFGALALWAGSDLPFMTRNGVGSGLFPRLLGGIVVVLGLAQTVIGLRERSVRLAAWPLRQIAILVASVLLFAGTIRGVDLGFVAVPPLGLLVAAPCAIVVSGLAADDVRPGELILFASALTAVCTGIFRYALGLSLPVAPWLIGY